MSQTTLLTGYSYNKTEPQGTIIALSTLFTYSAYGDTVVGFDVIQTTNDGGYLTDNGVPMSFGVLYGSNATGIPINQIGQWAFVTGPSGTADTIGFNVDDASGNYSKSVFATVTGQAAEPTLSSVSPSPVPASNSQQTIKLYGSNFVTGDNLVFTFPGGGTTGNLNPVSTVSSTEIDYTYFNDQNDSGTWQVQVKSPDGTLSNAVPFTVSSPPAEPTLSSVSPSPVPASNSQQTIKLYGSNFVTGDNLVFTFPGGGTTGNLNPVSTVSSTEIDYTYFNDQNDSGTWQVQVKSPDGTLSNAVPFTVSSPPAEPTLSSVSPSPVPASNSQQTIKLYGSNFVTGDNLVFTFPGGGTTGNLNPVSTVSSTEIDYTYFNDQNDSGTWQVQVKSPDGTLSNAVPFTVSSPPAEPTLSRVSPSPVPASNSQQTIKLYGSNFVTGDNLVFTFPGGGTTGNLNPVSTVSSTEIDYTYFNDQSDSGTWQVQVKSPDGTLSNPVSFKVQGSTTPPPSGGAAGFDRRAYPGASVMKTLKSDTNLSWVGYYLDASSQITDTGWLGTRGYLQDTLRWQIAPLYVGAQDPAIGGNKYTFVSQTDPTTQGTADAIQAIAEMGNSTALQTVYQYDSTNNSYDIPKRVPVGQGFKAGTVVYLDWENAPISSSGNNIEYIKAWCDQVAASSYVPGVYCPASDVPVISNAVAADHVVFWAGTWESGSQPTVQSTTTNFLTQPPTTVPNASSVQYGAAYPSIDNGLLSNVDLDTSSLYTACFGSGTAIATDSGETPVEDLAVGDTVLARGLGPAPVVWLGHRHVDCRHHPRPHDVWPIRIRAGAFGRLVPRRDLVLSPDHAVFINGVLIPIRYLVNGATVVQEPRDHVTYWHVELARHDLLLAEGLACESYLDTGNRAAFANGGGAVMLHPDFAWQVWAGRACAPLVPDGPKRVAAHRALLVRARALGHRMTDDPALRVLADGRVVAAERDGCRLRVRLPRAARCVRLLSRSAVPAQLCAERDDHRRLGVAVGQIALDGQAVALSDPRLGTGWHQAENGWRWTDGNATLDVGGARVLEVTLAIVAQYWRTGSVRGRRAA